MAKKDKIQVSETMEGTTVGEKIPKRVPGKRVKNTSIQKVELIADSVLIVFLPGEVKELPRELQIPSNIGLIII